MNYTVDLSKKWDYENGFYLTCETNRIGKFINHLEIYKKVMDIPGDILEFGVYKGTSLIRLLSFRRLLENDYSRKVIGFDMFGKFSETKHHLDSDRKFVERFENDGGYGILDDYGTVEGETKAVDEFMSQFNNIHIQKPPYNYIPCYVVKQ